ncbi:MAG: hypothetical protein WA350_04775, partial [Candidatus Sulfotelmatobacter sp.]
MSLPDYSQWITTGPVPYRGSWAVLLASSVNRKVDWPERHQSHPSISKDIVASWSDPLTRFLPLAAQPI